MDNEQIRGRPLLLGVQTNPLAITLIDSVDGRQYVVPITPSSAQALAYALLAQVGAVPLPELLAAVKEEAASIARADEAFLSSMGVADAN
jgi:hypothetical protein